MRRIVGRVIALLGRLRRVVRALVQRGRAGLAVVVVALLVEMLMGVPLVKKVRNCKQNQAHNVLHQ